jgi:hypothetical protein
MWDKKKKKKKTTELCYVFDTETLPETMEDRIYEHMGGSPKAGRSEVFQPISHMGM